MLYVLYLTDVSRLSEASQLRGGYVGLDQRSCSALGAVTTWMGDCFLTGKPSPYVPNHLG